MPLRFYRRVRVIPGVTVNLSRSGPSLSLGMRGAHITFGRRGITRTVGVPGTGVFYTHIDGYHTGVHATGAGWLWLLVIAIGIAMLLSVA
jgi:hypothetical protein